MCLYVLATAEPLEKEPIDLPKKETTEDHQTQEIDILNPQNHCFSVEMATMPEHDPNGREPVFSRWLELLLLVKLAGLPSSESLLQFAVLNEAVLAQKRAAIFHDCSPPTIDRQDEIEHLP